MYINEELIEELKKKNVILFAGAGVSMNLGLPSWGALISEMAEELNYKSESFQRYGDFLELAEYYKLKKGSIGPLRSWMDVNFHNPSINIEKSNIHKLILDLDFPIIYTTNYDRWIEKAFEYYKKNFVKITNIFDLTRLRSDVTQIIKFHGDFDDDSSIVLTETSYFERLGLDGPLDMKLRADTLGRSILFIGYSLSDINIRYMLFKYENIRPKSYIFLLKPNPIKKEIFNRRGIETIVSDCEDTDMALEEFMTALYEATKEKKVEKNG